ncbi:hypothetical protein ACFSJU_17430 [Paradesertivirga mongoliensis]|uniref:Uncharacterized protein n=1 Tax=Paradesertivirga mongoliensis TaxID=2100740 RepID=A0ABW4ZQJ9_9SPHI|nr:hypothetical protein [Pedobacter mongoliensis]
MRTTLLLLWTLTVNYTAFGMCMWSGINVWPKQQSISSNSIFIIEGYAGSQELIKNINIKNRIYLKSGKQTIDLKVVKVNIGQFRLTQAILKPLKRLAFGETYELHIDNLTHIDKHAYKITKWKVANQIDQERPAWTHEPNFKQNTYVSYGCGPEKLVNFCGEFQDTSPTLVYTRVLNKRNNSAADYYLISEKNSIALGHGMCAGEFSFDERTTYEVQFGLMDASGNTTKKLTKPISFKGPTESDYSNSDDVLDCSCSSNKAIINYSLLGSGLLGFGLFVYIKRRGRKKL